MLKAQQRCGGRSSRYLDLVCSHLLDSRIAAQVPSMMAPSMSSRCERWSPRLLVWDVDNLAQVPVVMAATWQLKVRALLFEIAHLEVILTNTGAMSAPPWQ
jgi:hypothetical protein